MTRKTLPIGLLTLYFLHAFILSFPMTAYGQWLFEIIHMPPSTTTIYYSIAFFPWNLKPLYGFISHTFPLAGYHRKSYLIVCQISAAISLLATGLFVYSITSAFAMKIVDAISDSFAQLLLGMMLVDATRYDKTSEVSAVLQSWANGVRNSASILALFVGIPLYENSSIDPRVIISCTSIFCIAACFVSIIGVTEKKIQENIDKESQDMSSSQSNRCLSITKGWKAFLKSVKENMMLFKTHLPTMVFFLICEALPREGSAWYQFTFSLLKDEPVCLQYSSLAGMIGRFFSCLIYGKWCSKLPVRRVFIISTLSSVIAGLPRLLLAPPQKSLFISTCGFCIFESFITSFTAEFALLQLLVVATYCCSNNTNLDSYRMKSSQLGLTYALFLSVMDFGGFLSGLLSSAVVYALGITMNPETKQVDWTNIGWLVIISAFSQACLLILLPLLPKNTHLERLTFDKEGSEYEALLPDKEIDSF